MERTLRQLTQSRRVVIGYPPRDLGADPFWEAVALRCRLGTAARTLSRADTAERDSAFFLSPYDRAVWVARYMAAFADFTTRREG